MDVLPKNSVRIGQRAVDFKEFTALELFSAIFQSFRETGPHL